MEDVEGVKVDHNAILKISSEACNTKSVFLIYALLAGNGRRPSAFPVNEELVPYPYEPKVILQNLILAVSEAAKKNQEKVRELDFALRLVQALSDDIDNQEKDETNKNRYHVGLLKAYNAVTCPRLLRNRTSMIVDSGVHN
jgi:hypothetical protein